jgi:hypothetical protein
MCFPHLNSLPFDRGFFGDGIIRVQHVWNWCREFNNGRLDMHDDCTVQRGTLRTDVNTAQVEELILEN